MVVLTSFPPPNEGIKHQQSNTTVNIQGKDLGNGTLFIAESRVSWLGATGGFSLEYPAICMHAVSRDQSAFPQECLFLLVEGDLAEDEKKEDGSSSGEEDSCGATSQVRFIPGDKAALDAMYDAMCKCQALHPDPEDSIDEEDEDDDEYYATEEGQENLTDAGQERLRALEGMLEQNEDHMEEEEPQIGSRALNGHAEREHMETEQMDTNQFDDADQ